MGIFRRHKKKEIETEEKHPLPPPPAKGPQIPPLPPIHPDTKIRVWRDKKKETEK